MKYLFLILISFSVFNSKAQNDTLVMHPRAFVDSVFYGFDKTKYPTGRLLNRLLHRKDSSLTWRKMSGDQQLDTISVDFFYNFLDEYNFISRDTSGVYSPVSIFDDLYDYLLLNGEDKTLVPIGVLDYKYNWFDLDSCLSNGLVDTNGVLLSVGDSSLDLHESRLSVVGPMFDLYAGGNYEFVFLDNFIITDDSSLINSISVFDGVSWQDVRMGEIFTVNTSRDSLQYFDIVVKFESGHNISSTISLRFSETDNFQAKSVAFECDQEGLESDPAINGGYDYKLKWCLLEGCTPDNEPASLKPFILVSGYRPPVYGISFKKLYKLYNTWHNDYIHHLRNNGYDVFMVKFNFETKPYTMGVEDASKLFIKFLNYVNNRKTSENGSYNENVIQGNSMGVDVVNLALLTMERKHFNSGSQYHHSRLFISMDANHYGANIPFSQQLLAKSKVFHTPITGILAWGFYMQISKTIDAVLFKELVDYHCDFDGTLGFGNIQRLKTEIPKSHFLRDALNIRFQIEDWGNPNVPIPKYTRNIAVSCGKINQTLDVYQNTNGLYDNHPNDYRGNGFPFANYDGVFEDYYIRSSVTGNYYQDIFKRSGIFAWFFVPVFALKHKYKVKNMRAIDNANGSFLDGLGNFGSTLGWIMATLDYSGFAEQSVGGQLTGTKFSHKSVVSALAINRNLWPTNESMTLDMQGLNLMYQNYSDVPFQNHSNHFGYPHLGNPLNHFDITPFEAIYVDKQVHPHINFKTSYNPFKDSLNNFLLNEIEPWYLGLQNLELGTQVQPTFTYKSLRRAKYLIEVGSNVTASTNPNPYIVKHNPFSGLNC